MVSYNGQNYSLDELEKLPEKKFRLIKEKSRYYDERFIPAGPAIPRNRLREVIEERGWDPNKVVIEDDFISDSKFRY